MNILALIPARGGSKRLPGKNIRLLAGKPLLQWTLETALDLPHITHVLLSTDDEAIAAVGRKGGALVPWFRPAELSTDAASSLDVVLHALDWYESNFGTVDGVLLLQPTSPFRSRATLETGIQLFVKNGGRSILGVSPAHPHPYWCFTMEADGLHPFAGAKNMALRSQDLSPVYAINGTFYLLPPEVVRNTRSLCPQESLPLIMTSQMECLDIDDAEDWQLAECYATKLTESSTPL